MHTSFDWKEQNLEFAWAQFLVEEDVPRDARDPFEFAQQRDPFRRLAHETDLFEGGA